MNTYVYNMYLFSGNDPGGLLEDLEAGVLRAGLAIRRRRYTGAAL